MTIKNILIFALILFSNIIHAKQNFLLKKIRFEGLDRVLPHIILKSMPISVGTIISESDIENTISSLFKSGNFDDIKTFRDNNTLIIEVKERPIIAKINILGNKSAKKEIIIQYLDQYDIRLGELLHQMKFSVLEKKIKEFYYESGYFNIKVRFQKKNYIHNSVILNIYLNEGQPSQIKKISIFGNHAFKTRKLEKLLKNKYTILSLWPNIFNIYQNQDFLDKIKKLNDFYLNNGYLKFQITSTQINFTPDNKEVYLSVHIYEGDKYNISKVILNKNKNLGIYHIAIKNLIIINSGEIYNHKKLINIENDIKNMLYQHGYLDVNITIYPTLDQKEKTVQLNFQVDLGKRYYIRKIIFQGNYISKDKILRREIPQMEGTWVNHSFIEEGKVNLNRTGYFEDVNFSMNNVVNSEDQVDLFYTVKERKTGSFNFGLGYSKDSNITFNGIAHEDNWFGTGYSIGISAIKNNHENNTEISLINPYFTIDGISLGGRVFYNKFKAHNVNITNYSNKRYGSEVTLSFPFNKNHTFSYGFGYAHNLLSDMKKQITILRYLTSVYKNINKSRSYTSHDFTLHYGWIFNNLNRSIFPTSGTNVNISGKITLPGSINSFHKIIIDGKKYIPLNKHESFVLLSQTKFGYGINIGKKEFPFYENFYLGGLNSIRGFRTNTIGPKSIYLKNSNICIEKFCRSKDAIGGNILATGGFELIFPVPLIEKKYSSTIRTSLFLDFGTTWDAKWGVSDENFTKIKNYHHIKYLRASTGISVQWLSPFGPLNFSYARPVKKYKDDQSEYFQFNIGTTW